MREQSARLEKENISSLDPPPINYLLVFSDGGGMHSKYLRRSSSSPASDLTRVVYLVGHEM